MAADDDKRVAAPDAGALATATTKPEAALDATTKPEAAPQVRHNGHTSGSTRAAAYAVAAVALFAALFIGLVTLLDGLAPRPDEPVLVEVAVTAAQGASAASADAAPASQAASPAAAPVPEFPREPFYVLLIGSDSRKGTALYTGKASEHAQVDQHADIITLMRVDPQGYTVTLLSIPRDTVIGGEGPKINDALLENDPAAVVDAVARLTGVRADYYMMTSFIGFEELVDALGGIVIDVPVDISVPDPATANAVSVAAGRSRFLHGDEALVLARARKEYLEDEDALRQVNVRNIERTLIVTVLGFQSEASVQGAMAALEGAVVTDLDLRAVLPLVEDFVEHRDQVTFYDATGPYEGSVREGDGLWVAPAGREDYRAIVELMDAGKDPSGVVAAPEF